MIGQKLSASCFVILLTLVVGSSHANAEESAIKLEESYTENHFFETQARVVTEGAVTTRKSKEDEQKLPLQASASFRFIDRRLPPAGQTAFALRAIRYFSVAHLEQKVGPRKSVMTLPDDSRLVVSSGRREGVLNYSPEVNFDGDTLQLLDLPGDPLAVLGIMPLEEKEVGAEWTPADWAIQMLVGMDDVETSELTCKLDAANKASAKITLKGEVKGNHLGAPATVDLQGTVIFDRRTSHVSRSQVVYKIHSDVGTVDPGQDLTVTSDFARTILNDQDKITPAMIEAVPFDPPKERLAIEFRVPEWGVELQHDRNWHLINTVLDDAQPMAILRLNEFGSLVAQCNLTPLNRAGSGQIIPLEDFESDIKTTLGERFQEFGKREEIPVDDGRTIFRVEAIGQTQYAGTSDKAIEIPMMWIYYLVANPEGRQASLVFALERPLLEQFDERDVEIVKSLRFSAPLRTTQRP